MLLAELLVAFLLVGLTSFGGMSMIPLISQQMLSHGWMTAQEVADIVAIAEMTPGPLGLNCATFAGTRTAGLAGAAVGGLEATLPREARTAAPIAEGEAAAEIPPLNITIPLSVDGMKLGEASIRGINAVTRSAGRLLLEI